MTKSKRPRTIWANRVNLSGLYKDEPLALTWYSETQAWWDSEGEFDVKKLGFIYKPGSVTFSSATRSEVAAWTLGAVSVMQMLTDWSTAHKPNAALLNIPE